MTPAERVTILFVKRMNSIAQHIKCHLIRLKMVSVHIALIQGPEAK